MDCATLTGFAADFQHWSDKTEARLRELLQEPGGFWIGKDFARTTDLSVIEVGKDDGINLVEVAALEMRNLSSPDQFRQMERLLSIIGHRVGRVTMDATGNGLGEAEFLMDKYGSLILLVNYSETVPLDEQLQHEGRRTQTMAIGERMAVDLATLFQTKRILVRNDATLIDDLRKPCRVYRNGRVFLAAARTAEDHADRFQAFALMQHGRLSGAFGAWTEKHLAAAAVGYCPVQTLPAFTGFQPSSSPFAGGSMHR